MFKETTTKLEGNEKYEGMGVDVIHELAMMTGFNYTFREQKEGGSGNPDKESGQWDGMIGEVISGVCISSTYLLVINMLDSNINENNNSLKMCFHQSCITNYATLVVDTS